MKAPPPSENGTRGPIVMLTISNGAGHTRAAQAIASELRSVEPAIDVRVLDVADYMTRVARFTHVTAYHWLVRHTPAIWCRIDRFQKRQPRTSPEWYYRRGCRRLFEYVGRAQPSALIATEVGCCEIAALLKRDLALPDVPLVAVNTSYDSDRAWVQREVDLYSVPVDRARDDLAAHGADHRRIRVWGLPLPPGFHPRVNRESARIAVCRWLDLDLRLPIVLIHGGSEGLGPIVELVGRLSGLNGHGAQLIVLAGRNARLRARCETIAAESGANRIRVLGWTDRMAEIMQAADLLTPKSGNTFEEGLAVGLPIVALAPPPGSETVQHELIEKWGVGRAVSSVSEAVEAISYLLLHRAELGSMRAAALARSRVDAAEKIARWVSRRIDQSHVRRALPSDLAGRIRLQCDAAPEGAFASSA